MRVGLVTNLDSRGLATDARLLAELLESLGHETEYIQYDKAFDEMSDLLIFCEVVVPRFFSLSKAAPWLFVNPEFLFERDFKIIRTQFGKILCKTREAHRICSKHFGTKAIYTGFLSADKMDTEVERVDRFLHVAGSSKIKGTLAVIDAWKWKQDGRGLTWPLTVVADWLGSEGMPENVTVLKDVSDVQLALMQNSHRFHLQPSGTEGWSHVLHEALSVNAVILTTSAPPMNELTCVYEVPSVGSTMCREAEVHDVSATDIHRAVYDMMEIHRAPFPAREEFLAANADFKERFTALLDELKPATQRTIVRFEREFEGQKRVAFLGNFAHSFCTESDLAWSLERMGHEVIRVQESTATVPELHSAVVDADMFLWVHTHGWDSVKNDEMSNFLGYLDDREIPSVFFHLDRYWGIPEREERIGFDACWHCNFVFTADGGNQDKFWARGVNHFWSPPAVVERGIHYGFPRGDLRCDVAFVGAGAGYHGIYPFRTELLAFLEHRYRGRFRHFQGVREAELNDVYASAKVIVGDSIFAGAPRYWSDRLPETCGRGGFLIFPRIEGMTIHCATYKPQDLTDLGEQIDCWLGMPVSRRGMQDATMQEVREGHTYRHRLEELFKVVFGA